MKTNLLSLAVGIFVVGCTDDGNVLFDSVDSQLPVQVSRSCEIDTVMSDTITPLVLTDEIKSLRETLDNLNRPMLVSDDYDYDPYLMQNIYALREIPVTITVAQVGPNSKAGRTWIRTRGKGNEVMLDYDYKKKNWGFRITPMPPSSGLNNLLYSDDLDVPLTIGVDSKGNKLLMAQANNDELTDCVSWTLKPSKTNPGYFQICSTHYIGWSDSSDPNSFFNYTLEAVKDNNLRFTQPVPGKKQQEFLIKPLDENIKFAFDSVVYNTQEAKIAGPQYVNVTRTIENLGDEKASRDIIFDFNVVETSRFKPVYGNIFPDLIMPNGLLKRPVLMGNHIEEPRGNTPKDTNYKNNIEQQVIKRIYYRLPVIVDPKHVYTATMKFQYNFVTLDYEIRAYYTDADGVRREMVLGGTWTGIMYQNPSVVGPQQVNAYQKPITGEGGGDIEL